MSLVLVANRVEMILGAQDDAVAGEGGSGERHFVEIVGAELFIFVALIALIRRADHERLAFLVQTENLSVVAPGRSAEIAAAADTSFERLVAGFGVETGEDAVVGEHVDSALIAELGGQVGSGARL